MTRFNLTRDEYNSKLILWTRSVSDVMQVKSCFRVEMFCIVTGEDAAAVSSWCRMTLAADDLLTDMLLTTIVFTWVTFSLNHLIFTALSNLFPNFFF